MIFFSCLRVQNPYEALRINMLIEAIQDETEILKDQHKDQRQTSGTMMLDN